MGSGVSEVCNGYFKMKKSKIFILFFFIFGCQQIAENKTESNQDDLVTNGRQQEKSIYELIIRKEERPDDFSKKFNYKNYYTGREINELNLDTNKLKSNEYYHLTDQRFLSQDLDDIDFKIYYRFLYGYLSERILRIERNDSIFDRLLSATGGAGQENYEVSTEFRNDSIFEEKIIFKSTVIDDPCLVADKIEVITTRFKYDHKFNFDVLSTDTFSIPNSAFLDFPSEEISADFQLTAKDSISLIKFWREKAFERMDTIIGSLTNAEILDFLYEDFGGKGGLRIGGIGQSPDQKFKILTLKGESCGAYCNPFWESEIILSDGTKISTEFFNEIDNIHLMPDGKYLVLQHSYGRPASVFTVRTVSAILLDIEDKKITYHPIRYKYPKYHEVSGDSLYNPSGQLSLSQEHFIPGDPRMTYDEDAMLLKYKYGTDFRYCCNTDSAFLYVGEFKYKNGEFKHLRETKEFIRID